MGAVFAIRVNPNGPEADTIEFKHSEVDGNMKTWYCYDVYPDDEDTYIINFGNFDEVRPHVYYIVSEILRDEIEERFKRFLCILQLKFPELKGTITLKYLIETDTGLRFEGDEYPYCLKIADSITGEPVYRLPFPEVINASRFSYDIITATALSDAEDIHLLDHIDDVPSHDTCDEQNHDSQSTDIAVPKNVLMASNNVIKSKITNAFESGDYALFLSYIITYNAKYLFDKYKDELQEKDCKLHICMGGVKRLIRTNALSLVNSLLSHPNIRINPNTEDKMFSFIGRIGINNEVVQFLRIVFNS